MFTFSITTYISTNEQCITTDSFKLKGEDFLSLNMSETRRFRRQDKETSNKHDYQSIIW